MRGTAIERDDPRLAAIYRYIVEYKLANNGNSPSVVEISNATGIPSRSLVAFYLKRLASFGMIHVGGKGGHRSITVPGYEWRPVQASQR